MGGDAGPGDGVVRPRDGKNRPTYPCLASSSFLRPPPPPQCTQDNDSVLLGLASISKLLQNNEYRLAFLEEHGCIEAVRILLVPDASIQVQYQAALCFWVMTFNKVVVERLEESTHHVVENISAVLKQAKKEKIVRVCFSVLRNLIENAEERSTSLAHAESMVSFKLLPFVTNVVNTKPYADEDLQADAEVILNKLTDCHEHMSTFDEYSSELKTGHLEWSPVHKSERFWRENAARLNDNKHALIKILVGLLQSSTDPTVLAVAAHDIGEYVRYYPRGKDVIEKWGGKALIMKNLQHDDAVVRYESLIAVQKLMTHNWYVLKPRWGWGGGGKGGEMREVRQRRSLRKGGYAMMIPCCGIPRSVFLRAQAR